MVLFPKDFKVAKSLARILRKQPFEITYDRAFTEVMRNCAQVKRAHESGTWISARFIDAYTRFHELGYAHSVEAWQSGKLVGGLYGVSLGRIFYGESMFSLVSNASKAAFVTLVNELTNIGFYLIDCQVYSDYLASFGAYEISRTEFVWWLKKSALEPTLIGKWEVGNLVALVKAKN
jgi:leucyl/phenylalanyl-tRNA--protein transferase